MMELLDDLRHRIENKYRQLSADMLSNVRQAFQNRRYYCMEVDGTHFGQLVYLFYIILFDTE